MVIEKIVEDVEKLPKFDEVEIQTKEGKEIKFAKGIVYRDTRKPIAVVSNRYTLIQFEEVFKPIIEQLEGRPIKSYRVDYYRGKAHLVVWFENDVGIIVRNSVEKSYAVHIRYSVRTNGDIFVLKGFSRKHIGNAKIDLEGILSGLEEVGKYWNSLLNELKNREVKLEKIEEVFGKKKVEEVREVVKSYKQRGEKYSWYEFWCDECSKIKAKRFRSEINKVKAYEKLSKKIVKCMGEDILEIALG